MYSYPFTEQGIAQALKEVCNTESPVIPESFCLTRFEGELGGKVEGTYELKTQDGNKYNIIANGREYLVPYVCNVKFYSIEVIQKIE